jgi:FMN-dependent NADH-azoreductase
MAKLIHIESSPRKARSKSIEIATVFIDAYQAAHPDDTVVTMDLWEMDLPAFDGDTINAKYRILHGEEHSPAEAEAWQAVCKVFEAFNAGDKFLFSLPMWNFGIPYRLKHFIDVILQPGLSFSFSPETGYTGLVTGKPAVVIYARGGAYGPGTGLEALDHQIGYMQQILGFIGISDTRQIVYEPTLMDPEAGARSRTACLKQASEIAKTF